MKTKLSLLFLFLLIPQICWGQLASKDIQLNATRKLYLTKLGVDNDEVEIGDGKSLTNLNPQVKLYRWNRENSLSIKFTDLKAPATFNSQTKTIEIKNSKMGFYFNRADDTNLKFGLIFYEKPTVNSWSFQLEGWEDLDFHYQPALTPQEIAEGDYRPPEVVGSYAVYHKTKRNHEIGKTNYMAGKFGHIYRPKFIDANNNWVWGDLHIENEIYTVSVSQDFLDNAVYPIKANDKFGFEGTGGSADAQGASQTTGGCDVSGTQYSLSVAGDVSKVTAYVSGSDVAQVGIYDTDANGPLNREGVSDTPTLGAAGWVDFTISVSLDAGAYGLLLRSAANYSIWYDAGTNMGVDRDFGTPGQLPDPWSQATDRHPRDRKYFIYATYTAAAGGAVDDSQVFLISNKHYDNLLNLSYF